MSEKGGHKIGDDGEEEFVFCSSDFPPPAVQLPPHSNWLLNDVYSSSSSGEEDGCETGGDDVSSVSQSASQVVRPSTPPKKKQEAAQIDVVVSNSS